tara:strand:- start:1102 stop:2343 length:1242 start_codon:yes stop_codon:yes gene_type:complete
MKNIYIRIGLLITMCLITFSALTQNNAFRIKIEGNGYSDETIIRMVNGASPNFDSMYDAWKLFSPNPNVPSIYTEISSGQELSINSLPEFTEDKSITLFTNIPTTGIYTLNIEEVYPLTSNYKISLTDIATNSHYRVLSDTSLTFTFNTQQNSPTFTFNISTPLLYSITNESCFTMNDGSVMIENAGNTDWNIEITDNNNSVLVNNSSNSNTSNFSSLLPGNYSVSVESKGIIDEFGFTINPAVNLTSDFILIQDTVYISNGGNINILNNSQNAMSYYWEFDDGNSSNNLNPTYAYSYIGNYNITLSSNNNNCTSSSTKNITVLQSENIATAITELKSERIKLSNLGYGNYQLTTLDNSTKQMLVFSMDGKMVHNDIFYSNSYNLNLNNYSSGIYILKIISEDQSVFSEKLIN